VAGHDCVQAAEAVRRQVGFVGHGSHVYEDLTALENLTFWSAMQGRAATRDDLLHALAEVELDRVAGERVRTFSVGMRRRLALARVALAAPRVLLLDEPSAGLDQRAKKWVEERLTAVKVRGGAVIMATHSLGRELAVADRVAMLVGGRVAFDTPRTGLGPEEIPRLYALHTEAGT
jgi:ABC-type multidrug transport system ATPase subunit